MHPPGNAESCPRRSGTPLFFDGQEWGTHRFHRDATPQHRVWA